MNKKIIYIDLDGVTAGCDTDYSNGKYKEKDFFINLKPCKNAIASIKKLGNSAEYEVYWLSTPSWSVPESYMQKRLWLEKYFGEFAKKKLILTHNKSLLKGDYLVDDFIENAKGFSGEFLHFGSSQFPDWNSILNYLIDGEHLNPITQEYFLTQQQTIAVRVIGDLVRTETIKTRLQAIKYMQKNFKKLNIDEANRVWIAVHKKFPDVWANGGEIKDLKESINKLK